MFKDLAQWYAYVDENWTELYDQASKLTLSNPYETLLAVALLPLVSLEPSQRSQAVKHLIAQDHGQIIGQEIQQQLSGLDALTAKEIGKITQTLCQRAAYNAQKEEAIDWLILQTGALIGSQKQTDKGKKFSRQLLAHVRQHTRIPSGIRVQAELISAGDNVIFAGNDVNLITNYYGGDKSALKAYLNEVRAELNNPDLGSIMSTSNRQVSHLIRLHRLYTPLDTWSDSAYDHGDDPKIIEMRLRAVEQDLSHLRTSAIETVAIHPRVVVIGSAGTGKSTLARFIGTCLAYACLPDAEAEDKVKGLDMLGPAWIHGALLPVYVNLRNFANDKGVFPATTKDAKAQTLIAFLRNKYGKFIDELEDYLTNVKIPLHGTILLLDGLDEVYEEGDRKLLKKVIENWADRFTKCRIVVTSRTYAYKRNAAWRLSEIFTVAELAPYTWKQMQTYVDFWYRQAALLRPNSFGGREVAEANADAAAKDLKNTILHSRDLWALARQPLLLTLITLIHEGGKKLPDARADLYERTVELLHKWNIPQEGDRLASTAAGLNFERVRAALQLAAFDLQRTVTQYHKPAHINQKDMLDRLHQQQRIPPGLGAPIEEVLEYLATRNGILVSGHGSTYRFLHLSIQEFLAACALIQQYDECEMPKGISIPDGDGTWTFPANIAALLGKDPYRWREVAIFVGSILATDKNQDPRWNLIEHFLPSGSNPRAKLSEGEVYSIYVAAEIWADSFLKMRVQSHFMIKDRLIKFLEQVTLDDRLDAPERARAVTILGQLHMDV